MDIISRILMEQLIKTKRKTTENFTSLVCERSLLVTKTIHSMPPLLNVNITYPFLKCYSTFIKSFHTCSSLLKTTMCGHTWTVEAVMLTHSHSLEVKPLSWTVAELENNGRVPSAVGARINTRRAQREIEREALFPKGEGSGKRVVQHFQKILKFLIS